MFNISLVSKTIILKDKTFQNHAIYKLYLLGLFTKRRITLQYKCVDFVREKN